MMFKLTADDPKTVSSSTNSPVSDPGPGHQLFSVFGCCIIHKFHLTTESLSTVFGKSLDVKRHLFLKRHMLHTRLHCLHQGLGLLHPQTLIGETEIACTIETGQ